ncbi:MAG: hypothetical protein HZA77_07545 [Candidatus Schekmanbacteria bacterium]|nr:hypothetical protein [Candidatus Schekmanbacteria bacterium]
MKSKALIFLTIASVFIIFRLSILLTSLDVIYDSEELYRGAIAKELITGRILPLFDYLYTDYEGGSLIMGMAAVPFFQLFGESYFALKLVTFIISLVIFTLWYFLLLRYFGKICALCFSAIAIFPAPGLLKISLTSWGNHFESLLFTTAALSLLLAAYEKEKKRADFSLIIFFAGLIIGTGIFFSYSIAPQLAALFFSILVINWGDWRFLKKSILPLLSGAIFGFLPGIYFNLTHDFAGFRIKGKSISQLLAESSESTSSLARLKDFFINIIPSSPCYNSDSIIDIHSPQLLTAFFYFISILILVKVVKGTQPFYKLLKEKKSESRGAIIALFLIFYIAFFALTYSLTSFQIGQGYKDYFGFRYMAPIMYVFSIAMAISASSLIANRLKWKKWAGIMLVALSVLLNINYDFRFLNFKSPTSALSYKGYNYFWLGQVVTFRYGFNDLSHLIKLSENLNLGAREEYTEGLGFNYGWVFLSRVSEETPKLAAAPSELRNYFYKGLGESFSYYTGEKSNMNTLLKFATETIPEMNRPYFYNGFGKIFSFNVRENYEKFFSGFTEHNAAVSFFEGVGEGIAENNGFNRETINENILSFSPDSISPDLISAANKGALSRLQNALMVPKNNLIADTN